MVAATVAASFGGIGISLWATLSDHHSVIGSVLSAAVVASFTIAGAVVASARPTNRVGWLMLAGGLAWSLGNAGVDAAYRGLVVAPGVMPQASAWAVAGSALRGVGWLVVTIAVAMVFPDGRLTGGHWRWLPRAFALTLATSVAAVLTADDANLVGFGAWRNPLASESLRPLSGALSGLSLLVGIGATVAAVMQLASRWRRGGPLERQQLMLFGAAAALPIFVAPVVLFGAAGGWLFSAAALPLPLAIGFAVIARGLYDLRTAANRTLVWVVLSAVVVGLYALVIVGLGGFLDVGGAAWLPWVAAVVVAISFAPLRDELQRAVNRLTFGRWEEPYDVLAALGHRLEATADAAGLFEHVVSELRDLGLEAVTIADARGRVLAGDALNGADATTLTLSAYGTPVGVLSYRAPLTGLRTRDRDLLDVIAGHLGGVLQVHQLTHDLQHTLEAVVLAREEERRRLRRDLHDGLGPALAGHLIRLDLLAGIFAGDPVARLELETLRGELRTTVLEVRRVVEGLRPPALDELGLAVALEQATQRLSAGSPLSVHLEIGELPQLPAAIEVAAFRIVIEAVTNVVRHAAASNCGIALHATDGELWITISDDGKGIGGLGSSASGHGLQTMRERAEELRGHLRVSSTDGTTIVGELPLHPSAAASRVHQSAGASR